MFIFQESIRVETIIEKKSLYKKCFVIKMLTGGGIIWSPADFVRLPNDKEMISL